MGRAWTRKIKTIRNIRRLINKNRLLIGRQPIFFIKFANLCKLCYNIEVRTKFFTSKFWEVIYNCKFNNRRLFERGLVINMNKKQKIQPSSDEFVYKMIKYSDKNIIEKIHNFEDVSKRKKLKETAKRAAYLCLYI